MQQVSNFYFQFYYKLGGGKQYIKAAHLANIFKGTTVIYLIFLLCISGNYTLKNIIYTCLHLSYGIMWVVKYFVFTDKNFEQRMTLFSLLGGTVLLLMYWVAPFQMIIMNELESITNKRILFCLMLYIFGCFLMLVSDAQMYFELNYRSEKNQLICDGLFKVNRNPYYLGEMMIYGSFALIADRMLGYLILIIIWVAVFIPNMLVKDYRLSSKPNFQSYKKQTRLFLFKFPFDIYIYILIVLIYFY